MLRSSSQCRACKLQPRLVVHCQQHCYELQVSSKVFVLRVQSRGRAAKASTGTTVAAAHTSLMVPDDDDAWSVEGWRDEPSVVSPPTEVC